MSASSQKLLSVKWGSSKSQGIRTHQGKLEKWEFSLIYRGKNNLGLHASQLIELFVMGIVSERMSQWLEKGMTFQESSHTSLHKQSPRAAAKQEGFLALCIASLFTEHKTMKGHTYHAFFYWWLKIINVNWKETKQFLKNYWNKGLDSLDLFKNSINPVELLNSNKFLFLPTDVCLLLHTDDLESGKLFIFFPLKLLPHEGKLTRCTSSSAGSVAFHWQSNVSWLAHTSSHLCVTFIKRLKFIQIFTDSSCYFLECVMLPSSFAHI